MTERFGRLTAADALAASQEDTARHEQDAGIIAALPLRPRPGLYIDHDDRREQLLVLEEPSDPEDGGAIIGLALPDGLGGWYLGCITCHGEIEEADAGMCQPCREDAAWPGRAAAGVPGSSRELVTSLERPQTIRQEPAARSQVCYPAHRKRFA